MTFGYDETLGWDPPTYDELLADAQAKYQAETTSNTDVTNGPAADMLRTMALTLKAAYDDQAGLYSAGFVDAAPGTGGVAGGSSLELLLSPKIGAKLVATKSRVTLTLTGTPTTNIPVNSAVTLSGETGTWVITGAAVIGGGGTVDADFDYFETGPKTAIVSSTWVIATPVAGWTSATNSAAATSGRNLETDAEYRDRWRQSTVDNMVAAVRRVAGVTAVSLIENATDNPDSFWGLARWVELLVEGGDNTAIANAIHSSRAKGVSTVGNTSVSVTDSNYVAGSVTTKFSRPSNVQVHVIVTVTKGEAYPGDTSTVSATAHEDAIKAAVVAYGNALVSGQDVHSYAVGVAVGANAGIPGIASLSVLVGTTDPPTISGTLTIEVRQLATIATADVDVVGA